MKKELNFFYLKCHVCTAVLVTSDFDLVTKDRYSNVCQRCTHISEELRQGAEAVQRLNKLTIVKKAL